MGGETTGHGGGREGVTRWRGECLSLSWKLEHHLRGDAFHSFHVLVIPEDEACLAVSEPSHKTQLQALCSNTGARNAKSVVPARALDFVITRPQHKGL